MGIYVCGKDDVIDGFEQFLLGIEGDVPAITIAECWNTMAKIYKWNDNLVAIDKFTKKPIID